MKKVVFSVTRIGRVENFKTTGVGYITEEDLLIPATGKTGKPYIRVFSEAVKYCHSVLNREGEFAGSYYEIREVEIETENSGYEKREIEMNYNLWFKYAE